MGMRVQGQPHNGGARVLPARLMLCLHQTQHFLEQRPGRDTPFLSVLKMHAPLSPQALYRLWHRYNMRSHRVSLLLLCRPLGSSTACLWRTRERAGATCTSGEARSSWLSRFPAAWRAKNGIKESVRERLRFHWTADTLLSSTARLLHVRHAQRACCANCCTRQTTKHGVARLSQPVVLAPNDPYNCPPPPVSPTLASCFQAVCCDTPDGGGGPGGVGTQHQRPAPLPPGGCWGGRVREGGGAGWVRLGEVS